MTAGFSVDPARWREQFDDLMGRIAGRFARVEPRRRARAFTLGLLSGLRRKNCWTIAELAGDLTPDGMHHLLEPVHKEVGAPLVGLAAAPPAPRENLPLSAASSPRSVTAARPPLRKSQARTGRDHR